MPTKPLSPCVTCKQVGCVVHSVMAWRSRYKAPIKRITGRALTRLRQQLWDRAQGRCQSCTRAVLLKDSIRDHIHPLAEGQQDEPNNDNCQLLCRPCSDLKTQAESARGMQRHRGVCK